MSHVSRLSLLLILLLVGGSLATGCYTVLRHPEAEDLVVSETGSRKACANCHVGSGFYHDAFDPWSYGFGGYWDFPGYGDYYFRPWWYRDFWYYDSDPHAVPGTPVETGGRHMWGGGGRRDIQPGTTPLIPGSGTQGSGSAAPSGSSPTGGSGSQSPGGNQGSGSDKPRDEKPRESSRSADSHRDTGRREMGTTKPPESPPPAPTPQTPPPEEDDDDDGGGRRS